MLKITQRYLNSSLTTERTLRFLAENRKRKLGSLCKGFSRICSNDSPKPTKENPAANSVRTPSPTSKPLVPCSVPVCSSTFCMPCLSCNSPCCNQCCCTSCCSCNPNCCTCNRCCYACKPCCYACNSNCPLFQPYYAYCQSSCACGSNKCGPCVPPNFLPAPPCCQKETVEPEKPSEIIFLKKGKVVHQNRRFSYISVDNPPQKEHKVPLRCPPNQV